MVANYVREFGFWLFVLWLALLVYLMGPPNTPPSAPAGVGIVHGFPVYAHPPVSYEDRYSPAAVGAHGDHCQCFDCFPYVLAVTEASVGVVE